MKKFGLTLIASVCALLLISQTATLRLQSPDRQLAPGEEFTVGIWLDALEYESPSIKSGQFFIEFDGDVITPVIQNEGYNTNIHPFLAGTEINLMSNVPFPGDLRFIILAFSKSGIEFKPDTPFPVKLWDITFSYRGGRTNIEWGRTHLLEPAPDGQPGGTLKRGATRLKALDNAEYEMTLIDTAIGSE